MSAVRDWIRENKIISMLIVGVAASLFAALIWAGITGWFSGSGDDEAMSQQIQNNANQDVTVIVNGEDDPEETEPTGPSQSSNENDSADEDGASDEQDQAAQPAPNGDDKTTPPMPERPALRAVDGTRIDDGALIRRTDSDELYVVKIADGQHHKRLFIIWDQLALYGHLPNAPRLKVSREVFDLFTTSCVVKVEQGQSRGFWYLDAKEQSDVSQSHRINATQSQLKTAGISDAAVFVIDGRELNFFQATAEWSAAQAASATCGRR